mmetsp:Transcript_75584/g.210000  ORF Transcript_75584/g.210000 Transcript_75584/m.210000 type:complete len:759 (-) Transcript_75584:146-2422(-)
MIPLSALGGGSSRPPGGGSNVAQVGGFLSGLTGPGFGLGSSSGLGTGPSSGGGPGAGGMIPLGALGAGGGISLPGLRPTETPAAPPLGMVPPSEPRPANLPVVDMMPGAMPSAMAPGSKEEEPCDTLAEIGKTARDYLDVLQPISIPQEEETRPIPKQVACLENGTDLFKMFDVDMHRFDPKVVRRSYHKMVEFVHPEKLGREPLKSDQMRYTKMKQAYTVIMDDQLRAVYRQHCFGIAGSGGTQPIGHEAALAKALEMGRDLRKMGEDRAIVLHKASEVGWNIVQKDLDGRQKGIDGRKIAHKFNLFGEISSSEDDGALLEKERRGMTIQQILEKSPKYADSFLEKAKNLLLDEKLSLSAAGGAFTMLEEPKALEMLNESPKSVQKHLRRLRSAVKQMNWAMTSLLQHKDSPWRGLETKASLVEHGIIKLLEIVRSGIAMGKFSEVHEEDFSKLIDNIHRLYMDLFERRGQELLRAAIQAELTVVYLLPESEGRLPDGTRVVLKGLQSRADLNGKGGTIVSWDYSLQRYTVELERPEAKKESEALPSNPDLLQHDDYDDADAEEEEGKAELDIPKKLMLLPKNAQVDLDPAKKKLENLVKDWNAWRSRPRSVSATQDAEAVAAALGPPLESMAGFLRDACSGVSTAAACPDGFDLVADECREALSAARNLAAKLLGEEPSEPPKAPSMTDAPTKIVACAPLDKEAQALKEAAEVAAAGIQIKQPDKKKKKSRSRSRSRRRRRRSTSSSSSRPRKRKK